MVGISLRGGGKRVINSFFILVWRGFKEYIYKSINMSTRIRNPEVYVKGYGKNTTKDDLKGWFREFGRIVCIQYKGPYSFIVTFSPCRSLKTTMMLSQQSNRWMTRRLRDSDSSSSLLARNAMGRPRDLAAEARTARNTDVAGTPLEIAAILHHPHRAPHPGVPPLLPPPLPRVTVGVRIRRKIRRERKIKRERRIRRERRIEIKKRRMIKRRRRRKTSDWIWRIIRFDGRTSSFFDARGVTYPFIFEPFSELLSKPTHHYTNINLFTMNPY